LVYRTIINKQDHGIRKTLKLLLILLLLLNLFLPIYDFARVFYEIPRMGLHIILAFVATMYLSILIYKNKATIKLNKYQWSCIGLLGLIFLLQIISYPQVITYSVDAKNIYLHTIFSTIFMTSFMWLLGSGIYEIFDCSDSKLIKISYAVIIIFLIFNIIYNGRNYGGLLNKLNILPLNSGKGYNYLSLGESFAFFTLLFYAFANEKYKSFIMFMGLVFLYAINSRASFYTYILVFLIIGFYKMRNYWKVLFFLFIVFALIFNLFIDDYNLTKNVLEMTNYDSIRMFRVFNPEKDTSWEARKEIFEVEIEELKKHWFTGNFLGELRSGHGRYIHNWLSFWSAYGVIPFCVFVYITSFLFIKTYLLWKKNKSNSLLTFIFAYSMYTIICIIVARSYTFNEIWFSLAAMCKLQTADIQSRLINNKEII